MMARAQVLGTPADWLVRAKHNCCLPEDNGEKLCAYATAGELFPRETLKPRTRCGFKSLARQCRETLAATTPSSAAMVRVL